MVRPKRFLALTASVAALALIAACGGDDPSEDGKTAADGGTLEITHWDLLSPSYGAQMWELFKGYEKNNGAASLTKQEITRQDYETTIKSQIAAGGGPDVLAIPDTFLPELAEAGALESLDGVFPADMKPPLNATNEGGKWRGTQMAITAQIAPYAFMWNKDILERAGVQPPTTPQELVNAAKTIKERTGITGFAVRHRIAEENPWWIDFYNWPRGFGGGWSDGTKLTIDRPENIAAVKAYKEIFDSGSFPVGDDASTFRTKFKQGQLAMLIDSTGVPTAVISEKVPSTSILSSKLPFPTQNTSHVGIYFGINKNAKNKELAKDFLRWLVAQEQQQEMSEVLGNASTVAVDTTVPQEYLERNPWVAAFRENASHSKGAVIEGFEEKTPRIRHIVLTWIEKVLLQDLPPEEALAKAAQEAAAVAR
ncbi:sugar ABC transporter [Micromonospora sonchi]|uniref:Sugar ABC transporter n=1 Tax=Micromonospora sonchi TaxID=1763543 RepID=A0A917U872_9ACTN|nr:extracellular solute-binding protein [Micromonospora sonchi]GGM65947.1 sugar ABC transporter [Micromonospora sonchi]